jgi:hypothetical protein
MIIRPDTKVDFSGDLIIPVPEYEDSPFLYADKNTRYQEIKKELIRGNKVCITDTYQSALNFYSWLKKNINPGYPIQDYVSNRKFLSEKNIISGNLLVPVRRNKIDLKKAPDIPWLKLLYPDIEDFFLPFSEVLGLNGSWQWYTKGIKYQFLKHRIHPFYGSYFSTRTDHMVLFDRWVRNNISGFNSAFEVGVGSGAITFLLIKYGIRKLWASDINYNSIISVQNDLERLDIENLVALEHADLFGSFSHKADLIIFNPPWIPGETKSILDLGIFYSEDLFQRFFSSAARFLNQDGRIVILFSNFAQIAGIVSESPIEKELGNNYGLKIINTLTKKREDIKSRKTANWRESLNQAEQFLLYVIART